jgi:hypothetical protein
MLKALIHQRLLLLLKIIKT